MRVALIGYPGLGRASGGFFYDGRVVRAMREAGAIVDDIRLSWLGYGYARGLAANALALPDVAGYDVILQDEIVHPSMCVRNRRLRRAGVPIISIVHNLTCLQPGTRRPRLATLVERAYLRSLDGVVAVCDRTRQDVDATAGRRMRAIVAYPGRDHVSPSVDRGTVTARATAPGPLRVLFAGVVSPHKGVDRLISAIAALAPGTIELDVAGSLSQSPKYVADVRRQIASARLDGAVRLHGELTAEALQMLYGQCQVFALPSDREAYSIAALDALGFGLPVLLPLTGGSSELITDGVEGRLLPPNDISVWTAALGNFARDRSHLAGAGIAARSRFQAHGTWTDTAAAILDFCKELRK